ncbi:unnamed protein product [Cuscuta campestris]|uniref:Uncharacterized protein n=1 Tax=Cuscuta campestris TaxID=132261 RepID=A0A484K5W2_9ASTE|nr:unnamed protein product [Cuscuta campestris]
MSSTSKPMKKVTKILVSVSLFSIIVSCSKPWRLQPTLFSLPITLDKNYIFLIFNGILVLLARTSGGIIGNSYAKLLDSLSRNEFDRCDHLDGSTSLIMMVMGENDHEELLVMGECCRSDSNHIVEGVVENTPVSEELSRDQNCAGGDDDEEPAESDNVIFIEEREVAEERERLNKLSADELNKKFEEFIWKMKEDIRIGAQSQCLTLVTC